MSLLSIHTYDDLLRHIPFRYEDYSNVQSIDRLLSLSQPDVLDDELVSKAHPACVGILTRFHSIATRRGITMQIATISDDSGHIDCVWFNQPYLRNTLRQGRTYFMAGTLGTYKGKPTLNPVLHEEITHPEDVVKIARILPVYEQTRGLSSKTIREKIRYILEHHLNEIYSNIPSHIEETYALMPVQDAFQQLHFPDSIESLHKARYRCAFEELFIAQLSSHIIKKEWEAQTGAPRMSRENHEQAVKHLQQSLSFQLTQAQQDAISDIFADMSQTKPMNRLLQGDVGSGKTIVALMASYLAYLHDYTTLYMAPTEILAQQQYVQFCSIFDQLPPEHRPACTLMTRTHKPSKAELDASHIIIGTHAILTKALPTREIGLVIVDEQHKFGVVQRAKLREKGASPHLLSMTATPIPRTVMLALYGELDVSRLYEVPTGRKKIQTFVVPDTKRESSYVWMEEQVQSGGQIFVTCPLIEQSESEKLSEVKAVTHEFEMLSVRFPHMRIGLLHGKLTSQAKEDLLLEFAQKKLDMLVTTPVIEVGIDIPGATVIVIEGAERFGLAQLHQLRGRVGRSDKQSYCLLFTTHPSKDVQSRLAFFARTHDGYELAEFDLHRRGAGTLYGTFQHGMGDLKIASLSDSTLVEQTKQAVAQSDLSHSDIEQSSTLAHALSKYTHSHISRD